MRFAGRLFYETHDGECRLLADFAVEAADAVAARRLILDEHWDDRLDCTGCRPIIKCGAGELFCPPGRLAG